MPKETRPFDAVADLRSVRFGTEVTFNASRWPNFDHLGIAGLAFLRAGAGPLERAKVSLRRGVRPMAASYETG